MKNKHFLHGDRRKNKISLSFDDGPNPFWTSNILDILDNYKVKAAFFVLGKYAERYPELILDIFNRGHIVGNHSYSHKKDNVGAYDFYKSKKIIEKIIEKEVKYLRPPFNDTEALYGYEGNETVVNNDVVAKDWEEDAHGIYERVMNKTKNGSIILFHDGSQDEEELRSRPKEMFKVLPDVIEALKKNFEIVSLDDLLSEGE